MAESAAFRCRALAGGWGQKSLDYKGEKERYLKSLLTNIRHGVLRLKADLLADKDRLVAFPRVWIQALSKADLFPDWDVHGVS